MTATRVWFQFKGQNSKTLPREKFEAKDDISQQVEIEHLRQWYRYAEPVYLVVYVESIDKFFAIDIKRVVDELWGDSVFKVETFRNNKGEMQERVTIKIPKTAEINDTFWQGLGGHRLMRTDGSSYQGNPLPHPYDFKTKVPQIMEPTLFTELVEALLKAHGYKIKSTQDALQLYPQGCVAKIAYQLLYLPHGLSNCVVWSIHES